MACASIVFVAVDTHPESKVTAAMDTIHVFICGLLERKVDEGVTGLD
jgi:hypothetical protein